MNTHSTVRYLSAPSLILTTILMSPAHAAPPSASQSGLGLLTVNGGTGGKKNDDLQLRGAGSGNIDVIDSAAGNAVIGSFTGVTGIEVNLKAGENQLELDNVDIPDTLTVNGRKKKDTVLVNGALVVGGFLNIALGKGDNHVDGNNGSVTAINVGLNANVDTGNGDDTIGLAALNVGGHMTIKVGAGNDGVSVTGSIGNRLIINAGPGDNDVVIEDTTAIVAEVFSGRGEDDVRVLTTQIVNFTDLITGGGDDQITTEASTAGNEYRINCGPGDDTLSDGGTPTAVVDCDTTTQL